MTFKFHEIVSLLDRLLLLEPIVLIKFVCGNCQARLKIDYEHAGEKIECPECQSGIRVPDQDIASGVVIGGFEIKHLIGKGGMGEVYLAKQLSMGRDIALKILPAHMTRDKSLVERFLKEVRNAARLDHPNIVTAYEAGEDHGIYYMAMTHIRGENVDEVLQRGPMDEQYALKLLRQVSGALDSAWSEHGVIHRDIKPENLILDHNGSPKILDMGLSKSMHDSAQSATSPDMIMGSPNYMSPEQIESSDDVDFRADMYSCGTTLYHMLTGKIPFAGGSYIETLKKQSAEQLDDPRTINPNISESVILFLERLLAKHPNDRFATWPDMIEGLDRAAAGVTIGKTALETGRSMLGRDGHRPENEGNQGHDKNDATLDTTLDATLDGVTPLKATSVDRSSGHNNPKKKQRSALWPIMFILLIAGGGALGWRAMNQPNDNKLQDLGNDPSAPKITTGGPSPVPPTIQPEQSEAHKKIRKAYSDAVLFSQSNPEKYDEAIALFADIGLDASGSEYALRSTDQIDRITTARNTAVQATRQALRDKIRKLITNKSFSEASTLVNGYSGPFPFELDDELEQLKRQIGTAIAASENQNQRDQKMARIAMLKIANQVADELLDGDTGEAKAILEQADADTLSLISPEAHASLREVIQTIESLPEQLMESYAALIGTETRVDLKTGAQTLLIKKINPNASVTATRSIRNGDIVLGHSTVTFSYDQLSTNERLSRITGSDAPSQLIKGMIYMQVGSLSNARKSFNGCGTKVGDLLKHRLDVRLGLAADGDNIKKEASSPFPNANNKPLKRPGVGPGLGRPRQDGSGDPDRPRKQELRANGDG